MWCSHFVIFVALVAFVPRAVRDTEDEVDQNLQHGEGKEVATADAEEDIAAQPLLRTPANTDDDTEPIEKAVSKPATGMAEQAIAVATDTDEPEDGNCAGWFKQAYWNVAVPLVNGVWNGFVPDELDGTDMGLMLSPDACSLKLPDFFYLPLGCKCKDLGLEFGLEKIKGLHGNIRKIWTNQKGNSCEVHNYLTQGPVVFTFIAKASTGKCNLGEAKGTLVIEFDPVTLDTEIEVGTKTDTKNVFGFEVPIGACMTFKSDKSTVKKLALKKATLDLPPMAPNLKLDTSNVNTLLDQLTPLLGVALSKLLETGINEIPETCVGL